MTHSASQNDLTSPQVSEPVADPEDEWITLRELSVVLGISDRSVYRLISTLSDDDKSLDAKKRRLVRRSAVLPDQSTSATLPEVPDTPPETPAAPATPPASDGDNEALVEARAHIATLQHQIVDVKTTLEKQIEDLKTEREKTRRENEQWRTLLALADPRLTPVQMRLTQSGPLSEVGRGVSEAGSMGAGAGAKGKGTAEKSQGPWQALLKRVAQLVTGGAGE